MTALSGLIPILATPFTPTGGLDEPGLRRLVAFQLHAGVDGLGLLGMASEAFTLSEAERDRVIRLVRSEAGEDVPLVVGAGGTAVQPALEQAERAVGAGADALMVMAPHLVKPTPDQLVAFFSEIASRTGVPVMLQDAPAVTGVPIPAPLLARICDVQGVDYVKTEKQPTANAVRESYEAVGSTATVIGGQNAAFLLEEYARGAVGTMPACEVSDALRTILDLIDDDVSAARARFNALLPLLRYGLQPGLAWAVHKHVLVHRGIIQSATVRAPALDLDRASSEGLDTILNDLPLPAIGEQIFQ